jgi:hypothetical protein
LGPGWAHRPADANLGFSVDTQLGIAISPTGQCEGWNGSGKCDRREGVLDPMAGLRLAGRFSLFEVAAVGRWVRTEVIDVDENGDSDELPFDEVYAGMTLGMTFDL